MKNYEHLKGFSPQRDVFNFSLIATDEYRKSIEYLKKGADSISNFYNREETISFYNRIKCIQDDMEKFLNSLEVDKEVK